MGVTAGATAALHGSQPRTPAPALTFVVAAASCLPVGLFLLRYRPRHPVSAATFMAGFCSLLVLVGWAASGWTVGAWLMQWSQFPPWAGLAVILWSFPDPPRQRWTRRIPVLVGLVGAAVTVAVAIAAGAAPRTLITAPGAVTLPSWARALAVVAAAGAFLIVAAGLGGLLRLVRQARRAVRADRRRYLCLVPAAVLTPVGVVLDVNGWSVATAPAILAIPLGLGAAALGDQWADLDVLVDRGVLAVAATTVGYAGLVVLLLLALPIMQGRPWPLTAAVLAGTVVLADPLRRGVKSRLGRWLYGERDTPFQVTRRLGQQLQAAHHASDVGALFQPIVEAVTAALRLPYARLLVSNLGESVQVAVGRRELVRPVCFPLVVGAEVIGALQVSPRREGESFTAAERDLLSEVARQAALVVHARALGTELQHARERLVLTQEQERLRLRNDLHDGIGPVLAGARMQVASALTVADPDRRAQLLRSALDDLAGAGGTVREIVHGLRPAALHEGLARAVSDCAQTLLPDHRRTVLVPDAAALAGLPAAVEVAAYRIVAEALTNVARHATGSSWCRVRLTVAQTLRIEVADDGVGPAEPGQHTLTGTDRGVGLPSIRARAEELGGWVALQLTPSGSLLSAELPLPGSAAAPVPLGPPSSPTRPGNPG